MRGLFVLILSATILPGSTAARAELPARSTATAASVPAVEASPDQASEAVTGTDRVLVRWSTRLSAQAAGSTTRLQTFATASGRTPTFLRFSGSGAAVYDVGSPLGLDAARILKGIGAVPGVASVEADLWMTADVLPNDPFAAQLWGLLGSADGSPYGIDARAAWGTTTGAGVVVAVIDTGLVAHSDLAGQSVAGYDMISDVAIANDGNGRDADASDPGDWIPAVANSSWHGTHVAGTIGALAGNGIGVFGGAPGVKIQPVRVLGVGGGYSSDIADGIRWAAGGGVPGVPANATPARVLNLSLGGPSPSCPTEYVSAIDAARALGAVVVVAAGNAAIDAGGDTPANCPDALTVAATDQAGLRASFSNFGSSVDLAAPGVGIWSTIDSGTTVPAGPTYAQYDGTSMATPHVALSAALLAGAHPSLPPDAIEVVLGATVTAFAADGTAGGCPALGCGAGIVHVGQAFARLALAAPIVGRAASSTPFPQANSALTVTAYAVDITGVASAQLSVDGGPWNAMGAADSAFAGTSESLTATITAPAALGSHTICMRATDASANTSDGTTCVGVLVGAAVTSDAFVDATAITGIGGSIGGTNAGASTEVHEPWTSTIDLTDGPNRTVWYRWWAPIDGAASVHLCGAPTFDTMMAVYSGSSLASLTRINDDDDTPGCGTGRQSTVSFSATSGSTYQIQVDGYAGETGSFMLTWSLLDVTAPSVNAFTPTTASPTSGTTIAYSLMFSESVTGLATTDFMISGSSSGWTVGSVACQASIHFLCRDGSGVGPYTVTLVATAPTPGTVLLTLAANSVADVAANTGPATAASAASVTAALPVPPTAAITPLPTWRVSTAIPLAWRATAGSAVVTSYDVRYRRAPWKGGFGSYVVWRSATAATSATFTASTGATYCFSVRARDFSVRARDTLGTVSAWTAQTCTAIPLDDRSLGRVGSWTAGTGSAYYRSTYLRSSSSTAKLVRTGVVARRIAIVATTCPTCGTVKVYWGSTLLRTIKLTSATTVHKKVIAVTTFTSARTGTLTIRISSSGRRVVIDGVAIRRN